MAAVRRAIELHPGWFTLLERLSPDFAPAGERVRRELELELTISRSPAGGTRGRVAGGVALVDAHLVRGRAGLDAQGEVGRVAR